MDSPTSSLISLAGLVDLDTYSIPPAPQPPMGYLLSLPYELRSQIWEEYLGYWKILDLRLYCRRRLADDAVETSGPTKPPQCAGFEKHVPESPVSQDNDLIYIGSLKQKPVTCYNRFYAFTGSDPPQWLDLLCTNRQVHQEVERVLFKRETWMVEYGELPLWLGCEREHALSTCTSQKYHSVHLTLQSQLPPSGNDVYGFYSTIFLSLINLRFLWNMYIEIELVDGRDMQLIDWICKTLSPSNHAHNNTTIAMRYVGQDLAYERRHERWTARHRREFMDAAWMRFQQPGLVIAGANYAGQRERPAGWCYTTLKERAPFTLISPINNERRNGIDALLTRVSMGGDQGFLASLIEYHRS